jgi:hypothetical protein
VQDDSYQPIVSVGRSVQITATRGNHEQKEFAACADPRDRNELAAAVMYDNKDDERSHQHAAVYVSHNAGATWSHVLEMPLAIDPACAFGPDGMLYVAVMASDKPNEWTRVDLYRTNNRGKSWSLSDVSAPKGRLFDRPWLVVDNSRSTHSGSVYFNAIVMDRAWELPKGARVHGADMLVFRSRDRGETIDSAATIPRAEANPVPIPFGAPGQMAVLSDGTVVTSHVRYGGQQDGRETSEMLALSRDGGKTFEPAFPVSGPMSKPPARPDGPRSGHFMPMVAVDASKGLFRDRIYVIWVSANAGRRQLWMAHSLGRAARQWAPAKVLDETAASSLDSLWLGPHHSNPSIAVNKDGVVGVTWAARNALTASDIVENSSAPYQPRFFASINGGETWSKSVALTPTPLREKSGHLNTFSDVSDFWGLTADAGGTFHAMWLDNRTGVPQLWTAPVTVNGKIHRLRDITDSVHIELRNQKVDSATNRAVVDVFITDNRSRPRPDLLVLKQVALVDSLGIDSQSIATNANNGWEGPGAIWRVPFGEQTITLPMGASIRTLRLEYRFRSRWIGTAPRLDSVKFRVFTVHP